MQKLKIKNQFHTFLILYKILSFKGAGWTFILIFTFCILNFIGCIQRPYIKPTLPVDIPGIYHRVEKGQTLWRISKIYSVDLDEIVRINHISDITKIEVGQLIFIPYASRQKSKTYKYSLEDFIWPLKGRVITTFGQTFNNMINKGINIQPYKSWNVVASRSGKVVFYDDDFLCFGKTIIIDHADGFLTIYARNSEIFVKVGDYIERGSLIAKVGSSHRDRSEYLHFEIRKGYIPQNPYFYLP